ncbi:hypothetical protein BDV12DRAFT_145720 [Aspergillus spectabilis]
MNPPWHHPPHPPPHRRHNVLLHGRESTATIPAAAFLGFVCILSIVEIPSWFLVWGQQTYPDESERISINSAADRDFRPTSKTRSDRARSELLILHDTGSQLDSAADRGCVDITMGRSLIVACTIIKPPPHPAGRFTLKIRHLQPETGRLSCRSGLEPREECDD